MIQIEINAQGGIAMLHDDAVNLGELGTEIVTRASNVEFASGIDSAGTFPDGVFRAMKRGWFVQSAKTGFILQDGFQTRAEALAWEKTHYSPSGLGWAELKGE